MDLDPPSSNPRKVKFAPKVPPRRTTRQTERNIEAAAEEDDKKAEKALFQKFEKHLTRAGAKAEKKSSVQVAFSHGVASSSIKSFGKSREQTDDRCNAKGVRDLASDGTVNPDFPPVETEDYETYTETSNSTLWKKKREYKEPWDYHQSYYPTTLPWRQPYSGDPELLDEAEFGEAASELNYDENAINSASNLGLLEEEVAEPQIFFLQLPANLPLVTQPNSSKLSGISETNQKDIAGSSVPSRGKVSQTLENKKVIAENIPGASGISTGAKGKEIVGRSGHASTKGCTLEELPGGYMGKMLVYKSGVVKMKLGDILYEVSPGSECACAQNVVAINTTDCHCCELGELRKRIVLTPDIDSLLKPVIDLG